MVKAPDSLDILAITGAAPVPVPPPMQAAMNTRSAFSNNWLNFSLSCLAASSPKRGVSSCPQTPSEF